LPEADFYQNYLIKIDVERVTKAKGQSKKAKVKHAFWRRCDSLLEDTAMIRESY
jgi:hypothetical protein